MLLTYRRSVSPSSGKDEVGQRKVIIFYIQYVISYKLQQDVREAHNAYRNTHAETLHGPYSENNQARILSTRDEVHNKHS